MKTSRSTRRRKIAEISPTDDSTRVKRLQVETGRPTVSYAAKAAGGISAAAPPFVPSIVSNKIIARPSGSRPQGKFIRGQASCNNLKAASPKAKIKKVICVSNVSANYSVEDIRQHCKNLDARLLFCFDISREEYNGKVFKLAFDSRDDSKLIDSSAWPLGVIIRPWRFGRRESETATGMDMVPPRDLDSACAQQACYSTHTWGVTSLSIGMASAGSEASLDNSSDTITDRDNSPHTAAAHVIAVNSPTLGTNQLSFNTTSGSADISCVSDLANNASN